MGDGPHGAIAYSRAAPRIELPGTQPWCPIWAETIPPMYEPHPGPVIGTIAQHTDWMGVQFSPGQGGDTPGAGGFGMGMGQLKVSEADYPVTAGYARPISWTHPHRPGSQGRVGARRSGA